MFVNRLPQILAERGLSIRELARRTGVTYSTTWAVVHSQRRSVQLKVLEAICIVLKVQPGEIYVVNYGDGPSATDPAIDDPSDGKLQSVEEPEVEDIGSRIRPDQHRRPVRSRNDWRSW